MFAWNAELLPLCCKLVGCRAMEVQLTSELSVLSSGRDVPLDRNFLRVLPYSSHVIGQLHA
ncbi:hypothetical protein MAMT_01774 [Methylacidimicrobium tartarophylax]|uniref:Uncharacterized protein n=1 Tax=Methylacidimicrobium tartarophylax TaxID=1041768 RepID=A0A5E6MHY1_9BACT|nr:hypothetical protein MAMT_01774 [Methylacidimicrobium tartarophylax]